MYSAIEAAKLTAFGNTIGGSVEERASFRRRPEPGWLGDAPKIPPPPHWAMAESMGVGANGCSSILMWT
eukprot:7451347-Pyramimonas_sp.AAC.1